MDRQIEPLAERLMAEGHFDNQADARLAAIRIILATENRLDPSAEAAEQRPKEVPPGSPRLGARGTQGGFPRASPRSPWVPVPRD